MDEWESKQTSQGKGHYDQDLYLKEKDFVSIYDETREIELMLSALVGKLMMQQDTAREIKVGTGSPSDA